MVYSNRTNFEARTTFPVTSGAYNSLKSGIVIHLSRIPTSGLLPFFFTLGEKGDYSLSVGMYSEKNIFSKLVVNKVEIMLVDTVIFRTTDSTFLKSVAESNQYYKSDYLIKLKKNISRINLYLDVELIMQDGSREQLVVRREITAQKDKGFSLFSI